MLLPKINKKGVALTIAIAMLLIAVTMETAFMVLFYNNYRLSDKYLNEVKAFYYAYGGYILALEEAKNGVEYSGSIVLPTTTISVTIDVKSTTSYPEDGKIITPYEITSYAETATGEMIERKGKTKLKAWVEKITPDNKLRLTFWREVEPKIE
jgi:hypothetical protein